MNKLRNIWRSMDKTYRVFILVVCLELSLYVVADICEWLVGVMF